MSRTTLHRLRLFVILVVVSVTVGVTFEQFAKWGQPVHLIHQIFGWTLGSSLIWGFELLFMLSRWGAPIRRLNFLAVITVKSLALVAIFVFAVIVSWVLLQGYFDFADFAQPAVFQTAAFVFLLVAALQAVSQVIRFVGGRVLLNFILGKYHHPLREERLFMFLDLTGSTLLAERLGDIGVQTMITRFFFDITEPIVEFGGEIHRYVGDQVVVTWPLKNDAVIIRAIRCYFAIADKVRSEAPEYERAFGTVPNFRVGLHGGPVVVSECGYHKQDISYFGDTINTAARIEQQCKEFKCPFLISGSLVARIDLPATLQAQSMGFVQLRGRKTETELFTITLEKDSICAPN